MKESILGFLLEHAGKNTVSFHMPGHKGSRLFRSLGYDDAVESLVDLDITEIEGADNLFKPETIIRETMNKYKEIYESRESFLLINGSSSGIIASIAACVNRGEKIIMARNCHKSVFAGVDMAGAEPVYVYPNVIEGFDITGEISACEVKKVLDENPDGKCLILPSPNYYGICNNIEELARLCHDKEVILIVDQAHGAHLKPFEIYTEGGEPFPKSAESQGADIVINSTHKTLCSFTQSAVLNIMTRAVDKGRVEDCLQIMESTSPSYILTASLDMNADIILQRGEELFGKWFNNLNYFYAEADKLSGINVMRHSMLDFSKINIDASELGYRGFQLEEELRKEGIFSELVAGNVVMCMTGIGNEREDFDRLLEVLRKLSAESEGRLPEHLSQNEKGGCKSSKKLVNILKNKPERVKAPRCKKKIKLEDAMGEVCASAIIPYPPGIPVICPGEKFTQELIDYLIEISSDGRKIIGIGADSEISVGK